jgi:hypothetical protein
VILVGGEIAGTGKLRYPLNELPESLDTPVWPDLTINDHLVGGNSILMGVYQTRGLGDFRMVTNSTHRDIRVLCVADLAPANRRTDSGLPENLAVASSGREGF